MTDLLAHIAARSDALRAGTSDEHRKRWGQFFTTATVARYMATRLAADVRGTSVRLLDLGAGTGILGVAAAQALLERGAERVELVAVEHDDGALDQLRRGLDDARVALGSNFAHHVQHRDALGLAEPRRGASLGQFDAVISNPPYFKMPPSDARGGDSPNAYTRFLEVASSLLGPGGALCFIIPRSFASGLYFRRFRRAFHARMALERVHVFESRKDAFKDAGVLQENIIVSYRRTPAPDDDVTITSSAGASDLGAARSLQVPRGRVFSQADKNATLFLPASEEDLALMAFFDAWTGRLRDYGLEISTGPVVPFRATQVLCTEPSGVPTLPLLWMQHVRAGGVQWPTQHGARKPQHIRADAPRKLLVPNRNYVLLRRFSAKEEPRRLTAAVLRRGQVPGASVGLENHLNFIHRPAGELEVDEAEGIAALLNARLVDRYFRLSSGNTQVNASEIRALPLPPLSTIKKLGKRMAAAGPGRASQIVEQVFRGHQ